MRYLVKLFLRLIWGFLTNTWNLQHWRAYNAGKSQNPPIFIVGCGHSGTSLLLSILGAHSRIYAVPNETALAFDWGTEKPRLRKTVELFLWYLDSKAIRAGKMRWVEKTPKHITAISLLLGLRPNAKIIIIIRDGRDVAISLMKRYKTLGEGIERWINDNRVAEPFWNHPNVYKMRYEDLIADFDTTMRDLLLFLGEDYEDQISRYYETPKFFYAKKIEKPASEADPDHKTYRNWQINQPLFDNRGKWKALGEDEKQLIKDVAGDMLIEYGYAEDKNW